jgi:cyclophilin family peptidyl-prolyl cis-trans isomerase
MKKTILVSALILIFSVGCSAFGGNPPAQGKEEIVNNTSKENAPAVNPQVIIETSKGTMVAELYQDRAPITVQNFLNYVDSGFYNGTIFHRIIPGFMIQGGGFEPGLQEKMPNAPIKNEAGNGLTNDRGTLAMARTSVVDSATAQFFVNVVDNSFLNHRDDTAVGYGYCVFGKVVDGLPTADIIANMPRHRVGYFDDVPVEDIVITSIKRK